MGTMNSNAATAPFTLLVGSKNSAAGSPGSYRVLYSRFAVPSLWKRCVGGGARSGSMMRAHPKNRNGSRSLGDADVLASRDSMEGGEIDSPGVEQDRQSKENSPVWISRDSLEDTVGSDASQMLEAFTGGGDEKNEGESHGKVGADAFDSRDEKDLDDIEQQYLLNDKLAASETGIEPARESISGNSDTVGSNLKEVIEKNSPKGEDDSPSPPSSASSPFQGVLPNSSGRDWRVWAERPNDAADRSFPKKKMDQANFADRLGHLEELVMARDNSNSAEDYNRRATIFEKSDEAFRAQKCIKEGTK